MSGCVLTFRDVSETRRVERERARQFMTARLLASIIESSDDAIVSKSLTASSESWNAGAERIFGYPAAQAVGRHISRDHSTGRLSEEDRIRASLKAGKPDRPFRNRAPARRWQPHCCVVDYLSAQERRRHRHRRGRKIVRDITDRKRAEAEKEKFVTLIENSTDFIRTATWRACRCSSIAPGSRRSDSTTWQRSARVIPMASFFFPEIIYTGSRRILPSVLGAATVKIEVRFRHFKTGDARWMAYEVLALPDASGRPSRWRP